MNRPYNQVFKSDISHGNRRFGCKRGEAIQEIIIDDRIFIVKSKRLPAGTADKEIWEKRISFQQLRKPHRKEDYRSSMSEGELLESMAPGIRARFFPVDKEHKKE